uniref:Uncharacterized protein n=1 Tax=Nelumbo nucifera TaxID=4432 RepID=A0A822XVP7_NELNU|nr:TPA_asm: hypothetical protein HUJ06_024519 [Nelumbo nucifera]
MMPIGIKPLSSLQTTRSLKRQPPVSRGFTRCKPLEPSFNYLTDLRPTVIFLSSTRTIKAISEVEAFTLIADDLKFVALQFRRLHSKQLRHKFRFYSHQWRTWAACFIQAAWHRFKRRKDAAKLKSW